MRFFCLLLSLILCGLCTNHLVSARSVTVSSTAERKYAEMSREAAINMQAWKFDLAIRQYRKVIEYGKANNFPARTIFNTKLLLAHCLSNSKHFDEAKEELSQVERWLSSEKEPNPAMLIRLQRRKVEMYDLQEDFKSAVIEQRKVCDLYLKNIGKMVLYYFGQRVTLVRLERQAGNLDECIKVALDSEKLMKAFHLSRNSAVWSFLYLDLGKAYYQKGQFQNSARCLKQGLGLVRPSDPDISGYTSAWLAVCARTVGDKKMESEALAFLCATFSDRKSREHWLARANSEANTKYQFHY